MGHHDQAALQRQITGDRPPIPVPDRGAMPGWDRLPSNAVEDPTPTGTSTAPHRAAEGAMDAQTLNTKRLGHCKNTDTAVTCGQATLRRGSVS